MFWRGLLGGKNDDDLSRIVANGTSGDLCRCLGADVRTVVLPVSPCAKPRMTRSDKWKERPIVAKYRAFCDELRYNWNLAGLDDVPAEISLVFRMPMPPSWGNKKRREMNGQPHQQTPDIDNLCKAVLDALLSNDSHIYSVQMSKYWATNGAIEVGIK